MKQLQTQNTELDERLKHSQEDRQKKDGLHRRYNCIIIRINNYCCHLNVSCVAVGIRNPDYCYIRKHKNLSHKNDSCRANCYYYIPMCVHCRILSSTLMFVVSIYQICKPVS